MEAMLVFLAFSVFIFGGMPLLTLALVGLCTMAIALPLGWLFGCI